MRPILNKQKAKKKKNNKEKFSIKKILRHGTLKNIF
jgi:hypothetical protein